MKKENSKLKKAAQAEVLSKVVVVEWGEIGRKCTEVREHQKNEAKQPVDRPHSNINTHILLNLILFWQRNTTQCGQI